MSRPPVLFRVAVSLGLLAGLVWWLDVGLVVSRLVDMRAEWVLAALVLSVGQVATLAWRWRFTAGRLGVDLPFATAWREYYLSIFLNQVLPGGVLGDASRAWRQVRARSRLHESGGPALRAVVFERVSAQVIMTSVAVVSLLALPVTVAPDSRTVLGAVLAVAALSLAGAFVWVRVQSAGGSLIGRVITDFSTAHFSAATFTVQLLSGLVVVGSYLATYIAAARAVGVETELGALLPLVAPVLMSMLVPVTVAGWGLREGVAAMLWGAVGLTAADGVLVSIAYGLLVLAGSLPGAFCLLPGLLSRSAD